MDIYDEWKDIVSQDDPDLVKRDLQAFYQKYQQEFVTEYAASDPKEDIAESWSYFVIASTPDQDTIADQKISFFHEFPELVTLRLEIRSRICKYFGIPQGHTP